MSIRTLDQLCVHLSESLHRAEGKDWCAITLLADDDTEALLIDLLEARDERGSRKEGAK